MLITRGRIALAVLATSGVLAGWGGAAHAATMDTLDQGSGSLTDGNATYSDFVYGGTTLDSTVTAIASRSGDTSAITFARTATPWNLADDGSQITFDVTFADPITTIGLDFLASATGNAMASVGETIMDPVTHDVLASLQVNTGLGSSDLTDSYTFATPVSSLEILKSIDVAGSDGLATITSVDNTYTSVPEPASLGLLGLGALAMIKRRRR